MQWAEGIGYAKPFSPDNGGTKETTMGRRGDYDRETVRDAREVIQGWEEKTYLGPEKKGKRSGARIEGKENVCRTTEEKD